MTRGVFLDRAGPDDVPGLAELEAVCFTHPWTASQIAEEVAAGPPGAVLVLRAPLGRGRTVVCGSCAYRVVLDEMQILDLTVHPGWRRRGLARVLLRVAIRRAVRVGARTALLEVRVGNAAALALYESFGFVPCGRRRDYYREPTEDAALLRRESLDRQC